MPGTTTDGWPYALPADARVDWPALSQTLANLLESRWDTYESTGLFVATAPWQVVSGLCTRSGGMVTLELILACTTAQTLGQSLNTLGTLPTNFRPTAGRQPPATLYTGTAWAANGVADIFGGGSVGVRSAAATTIAANSGSVGITTTFRGAAV